MRLSALLGESYRDVRSGTTRVLLLSLVLGALLAAGTVLTLSEPRGALLAAEKFRDSGGSVTVLRADGRIDGGSCDALSRVSGVQAAGALRKADADLVPSALPGNPLPTKETTPGFASVVSADIRGEGGLLLSDEVMKSLSLGGRTTLPTHDGDARISGSFAYPDDGRQGDLGFSALMPQISGDSHPYDECWADVWPQSDSVVALMRTTILAETAAETDERPTSFQLNGRLGSHFASAVTTTGGSGLLLPAGTALAGLFLGAVSVRVRRLELASARHAGVTRSAQTLGHVLQGAAWIAAATVAAFPTTLILVRPFDRSDAHALMLTAGGMLEAAAIATLAGIAGACLFTSEKHLFRYFKSR